MNEAWDNKKREENHKRVKSTQSGTNPRGSKYSKKNKGRKPSVKRGEPVFLYFVQGTDTLATKTPCEKNPEATALHPSQSTLGTWKNPLTGKKCKVTRVRNKPKKEVDESKSKT